MPPEKIEIIINWFNKGEEDILTAELVIEASPTLYDVAAFHSQQAAEKYLKSFLAFNEVLPPRTHDIKTLIDLAISFDSAFDEIRDAESLSKYAVRSRYPDDFDIDTKEQALIILNESKRVKNFVIIKIGDLNHV